MEEAQIQIGKSQYLLLAKSVTSLGIDLINTEVRLDFMETNIYRTVSTCCDAVILDSF